MKHCLAFVLLLLTACDRLSGRPGAALSIDLIAPVDDIWLDQAILPVHLVYQVTGCDDFSIYATVDDGVSTRQTLIQPGAPTDGWLTADVPVDAVRPEINGCSPSDFDGTVPSVEPLFSIEVRCLQDGRSARSPTRAVHYRPGDVTNTISVVEVVYPQAAPGAYALASQDGIVFYEADGSANGILGPGINLPPLLAFVKELSPGYFVDVIGPDQTIDLSAWGGSTTEGITGSTLETNGRASFSESKASRASLVAEPPTVTPGFMFYDIPLPGLGIDIVEDGNDVLVITASETLRFYDSKGVISKLVTFVERVDLQTGTPRLQTVTLDEVPVSPVLTFQGAPALLTRNSAFDTLRFRRLDGSLIEEEALAGTVPTVSFVTGAASTSFIARNDGSAWTYTAFAPKEQLFIQRPGQAPQPLESELTFDAFSPDGPVQPVWLANGDLVVGERGSTQAELHHFDESGDHHHLLTLISGATSSQGPSALSKIVALANGAFAVLTATGVQVMDANGDEAGGADPLPVACRQNLLASDFAAIASDTVGLATGTSLIKFRTSGTTP